MLELLKKQWKLFAGGVSLAFIAIGALLLKPKKVLPAPVEPVAKPTEKEYEAVEKEREKAHADFEEWLSVSDSVGHMCLRKDAATTDSPKRRS